MDYAWFVTLIRTNTGSRISEPQSLPENFQYALNKAYTKELASGCTQEVDHENDVIFRAIDDYIYGLYPGWTITEFVFIPAVV